MNILSSLVVIFLVYSADAFRPSQLVKNRLDECYCPKILLPVCARQASGDVQFKTYDNACLAECSGAVVVHEGKCPLKAFRSSPQVNNRLDECSCTKILNPVCARQTSGDQQLKTFNNACMAECSGAVVVHEGNCVTKRAFRSFQLVNNKRDECSCPKILKSVCAAIEGDHPMKTFGNECLAQCQGYFVVHEGACIAEEMTGRRMFRKGVDKRRGGEGIHGCRCPKISRPVCASEDVDGVSLKTYGNDCLAKCDGFIVVYNRACTQEELNQKIPECNPGCSYIMGGCECQNDVSPMKTDRAGCACPYIHKPVCARVGVDDAPFKTYVNDCLAECEGSIIVYQRACTEEELNPEPVQCGPGCSYVRGVCRCKNGNELPEEFDY